MTTNDQDADRIVEVGGVRWKILPNTPKNRTVIQQLPGPDGEFVQMTNEMRRELTRNWKLLR